MFQVQSAGFLLLGLSRAFLKNNSATTPNLQANYHTSRNNRRSALDSISSLKRFSARGRCPTYVGYANRNSLAASKNTSPILWMIGACSRCRTYIASTRRLLHSRRSRMFPKTSSTNSSNLLAGMTGGLAFSNGRMNSYNEEIRWVGPIK